MTSSSDTFPFGIADVVELLGLTVRRRLPSSLYLNCPFCGDQRGRLNVNTDKNVWRCNRCGAAGGMLPLYGPQIAENDDVIIFAGRQILLVQKLVDKVVVLVGKNTLSIIQRNIVHKAPPS